MTFPQGILYIHNTMWVQPLVCVWLCFYLKYLPPDINYLHESRVICMCMCVCMCFHGSCPHDWSTFPQETIAPHWLNQVSQSPMTEAKAPGPASIAETRVWLVGNVCACMCVFVCVWGQWKHSPFHLQCPHRWRRRGDVVSVVTRVKCR